MKCEVCNEIREIKEFPKRRKNSPIQGVVCRKCSREIYKKNYYARNLEVCLERSKKQKEDDSEGYKKYLRNYYKENKEYLREKSRTYGREHSEERNARYRVYSATEEGKTKNAARKKVAAALRKGSLVRPSICEECEQVRTVEAHHEDYSKPLNIQWLCKECHWKRHSAHHLNEEN